MSTSPPPINTSGVKAAHGNAGKPTNVLRPPGAYVFLWLRFKDPDDVIRDFPEGLKVKVRHGTPPYHKEKEYVTTKSGTKSGLLTFPAKLKVSESVAWQKLHRVWGSVTLIWDETTAPAPQYILCEPDGATAKTQALATEADLRAASSPPVSSPPAGLKRFFRLPAKWSLKSAEWTPPTFPGRGSYDAAHGVLKQDFFHIGCHDIGKEDNPVVLVLLPHWRRVRFEFFDRRWGHASHGDKRISPPPLTLRGFRKQVPANTDPPDSESNWYAPAGGGAPASAIVQAMPWINWFTDVDAHSRKALPKLKGQTTQLRFQTPANSWVYSKSATERRIVEIPANDPRLAPAPARLEYYDLPALWKSKVYYTRIGASGKFYKDVTEGDFDASAAAAQALGFSLDDLVLFRDDAGTLKPLDGWATATDRVVLLNHRFDATVGASPTHHGVHKPKAPSGAVTALNFPHSDVVITRTPGDKDVYLYEYPDWTRLVLAQGNVFDVFDLRAPDSADNDRVVGARTAIRWVDATHAFPGVNAFDWSTGAYAASPDNDPLPGRRLDAVVRAGGRPALIDKPAGNPIFAYQPFHFQNCTEFPNHYDPAKTTRFGRFDMLLLRCCDVTAEGDELVTQMHYIRSYWDGGVATESFRDQVSLNTSKRWNGADAVNNFRALLLPTQAPPPKLKIQVVWFDHAVEEARAHFKLTVGAGRSNRGSEFGEGEYAGAADMASQADGWHTSAHESGHMNGLPDDYNERWDCASYDQMSYRANGPPGDPYEPDGRLGSATPDTGGVFDGSMMNVNTRIRGRYFWPSAEWASQVMGSPLKVKYRDPQSTGPYEYELPQHPQRGDDRTYLSWPFLAQRNATRNAASPTSPPSPNWDQFEYYLYVLGKDHYSQHVLPDRCQAAKGWRGAGPGSPPAGPVQFDGLLVIDLRLDCTLPTDPTQATEDLNREAIAAKLAKVVNEFMCFRWRFQGNFGSPPRRFENCLIHFAPLLLVSNDNGHYGAPRNWNPAAIAAEYGTHFNLTVNMPPGVGDPAVWNTGARRLTLNAANDAQVENRFRQQFPKFFGFDKTVAAVTAADVRAIVDLLGGTGVVVTEVP